jgi:hypothetical protein
MAPDCGVQEWQDGQEFAREFEDRIGRQELKQNKFKQSSKREVPLDQPEKKTEKPIFISDPNRAVREDRKEIGIVEGREDDVGKFVKVGGEEVDVTRDIADAFVGGVMTVNGVDGRVMVATSKLVKEL